MTHIIVHPLEGPLTGGVPVPSDKSIGHRALLFGALANGTSRIRGFSRGEDNVSTARAMAAMGATITDVSDTELEVKGTGLFGLVAPAGPIDCGNSGTTMRLLTGLLSAQPFQTTLIGDETLSRRPMMRVVGPLRARGAIIEGTAHPTKEGNVTAPLVIGPLPEGTHLGELEFESPVASAQVKSAILLSGLYAHGVTRFREPSLSRDHTERMLLSMGAPLKTVGPVIELDPAGWRGVLDPIDVDIPGDISAAAFLLVAAATCNGSRVTVRGVGTNPTRTGVLEILRDMGAGLEIVARGDQGGEPVAEITAWGERLRPGRIGGELVPRAIDEIPVVCALAARAEGETVISDAEELRVKESDRIATMVTVLRAFGVSCEERPDGLTIKGRLDALTPAVVDSKGDHRIAMAAAVMALHASGPTRIDDCACIATSFPRFVGTLRALGAKIDVSG